MHVIDVRNVNEALPEGIRYLRQLGVRRDSRNGPVLVAPCPVTTAYLRPMERVLFDEDRDANPFFHLVEALWMLAGRDDLATLTPYVASMANFSDDGGKTQPGAYGKRWRDFFKKNTAMGPDQLSWAITRLKNDPNDRRVVIQMYDANRDQAAADAGGKDIPCNIVAAPWIDTNGRLSMSIFCRSNDIVLGAYGANAVHFSIMQEYLACGVGVHVGSMYQISNNYHAYLETIDKCGAETDFYKTGRCQPFPLVTPDLNGDGEVTSMKQFDEDLTIFFKEPSAPGLRSMFLRRVACPIVLAHQAYRNKKDPDRFVKAFEILGNCHASDWQLACHMWLARRYQKWKSHD